MKELWGYLKGFFITIGLIITLLIFLSVLESSLPEWSGNPIDDLLYYAYDYEKFGSLASIWRLFIMYAVVMQSWVLLKAAWAWVKSKIHSSPASTTQPAPELHQDNSN